MNNTTHIELKQMKYTFQVNLQLITSNFKFIEET